MPFNLATAPGTLMRLMTIVFSGILNNNCLAYLYDIIINRTDICGASRKLDRAHTRVQSPNLKLKPSKCPLGQ